jgi:hypothetical protein
MTARSLEVRITEYRDNLRSIAGQIDVAVTQIEKTPAAIENPDSMQALRESVRLYNLIADDLTKVINGEELNRFAITGEIPS